MMKTHDALINAESAMFHVLADDGFNSPADKDAMQNALKDVREAIANEKTATEYLNKLLYHINTVNLDMGGNHKYSLSHSGFKLVSEIRAWLVSAQ